MHRVVLLFLRKQHRLCSDKPTENSESVFECYWLHGMLTIPSVTLS